LLRGFESVARPRLDAVARVGRPALDVRIEPVQSAMLHRVVREERAQLANP
jgi:hypothetical protein